VLIYLEQTLLGFLTLAFVLAPMLFYKYGERLRSKEAAKE